MNRTARIIAATAIVIFGMVHEWWLFDTYDYYPEYWAMGFWFLIPSYLGIAIGTGVAVFFALRLAKDKKRAFLIISGFILAIVILQRLAFPSH